MSGAIGAVAWVAQQIVDVFNNTNGMAFVFVVFVLFLIGGKCDR